MRIDVNVDGAEYERACAAAQAAGMSIEEWVRDLIRDAARPSDPLFGYLADEPELTDAIDEVVGERSERALRTQ